jgi:hypothetical protein
MAATPSIDVCNLALGEVRAKAITSINDNTPEARACATYYQMCLQSLLEAHPWSYAQRRATLATLLVNDRDGEWGYAYAKPADMASGGELITPGMPPTGVFSPWPSDWPRPVGWQTMFVLDGGTIYTNLSPAVLQYTSYDLDEASMPMLFKKALSLELASYLAVPLRDDRTLKGELIQQAEVAKQRAMADDINRQPNRDVESFDPVAFVRAG